MRSIFYLPIVLFLLSLSGPQPRKQGYKLVWSDEFNKDGRPDPANWTFEHGFVRNHEAQWYQPENAWCAGGHLIIEARKESKHNPLYEEGSSDWRKKNIAIEYTSACLLTKGLHSFRYGRFEMCARIDVDPGLWPAFWTLGAKGEWPSNGEIDIMEFYRGMLLANIATGTDKKYQAFWFSRRFPLDSLGGKDWASRFHTWRMDWDDHAIRLSVDDRQLQEVHLSDLVNRDGSGVNPFRQPQYIVLNLALGGDNGGDPAATTFPRRFEIDYIRVYQK
jgi:beta-glucanase (GH16 family)